jgi:ornithine cyclodeaminase/alanine dehydrogenase-like protein (mu-crystallin family)
MSGRSPGELVYLSRADVAACAVTAEMLEAAIRQAFVRRATGGVWSHAKVTIGAGGRNIFRGKGAAMDQPAYAAFKWFGYFPDNGIAGLPDYMPLIILNEAVTGRPLAVMDGVWISSIRTALISLIAARSMARTDATTIGFLACGAQAQSHLEVFSAALPLTDVVTFSRRLESAEALATLARDKGLRARAVSDARAAIAGCDIIISSIPHGSDGAGQLDANWVEPGTFVASVDLGFGWQRASLAAFDRTVTDDREMSTVGPKGTLNYDGPFAAELSDLVTGRVAGRESADERNALIFSGTGIADLASAIVVYEAAIARGIGTRLSL